MAFGFSAISKKCVETAIPYTTKPFTKPSFILFSPTTYAFHTFENRSSANFTLYMTARTVFLPPRPQPPPATAPQMCPLQPSNSPLRHESPFTDLSRRRKLLCMPCPPLPTYFTLNQTNNSKQTNKTDQQILTCPFHNTESPQTAPPSTSTAVVRRAPKRMPKCLNLFTVCKLYTKE